MPSVFRVVIFSGTEPPAIRRLITRIHREVPEAKVCGVLCERRPGKPLSRRIREFLRNLRSWDFVQYAASKTLYFIGSRVSNAGDILLQFVHGSWPVAAHQADESLECPLQITTDYHCKESLAFVHSLQPDLGIIYGTRILKPSLFTIPRLGSINIHKRRVPDYRGGGPVGLWELLDGQSEIGVTVHQVTEKLDAGAVVNSATIPIDDFDNLTSLALKAHIVGNELLARSVADFAKGTVCLQHQQGVGRMFKSPSPQRLAQYEKELAQRRASYSPPCSRPLAKLLLKSLLAIPSVTIRNWRCRFRGSFPVTILFHHLVSDRPHRLGISTEHFLKHVQFLQRHYQIVSLSDAIEMLKTNSVRRPTVVLTFDDGYRDNFIGVRAIVEQTGVPIAMFVSTDHVTQQNEFKHDAELGVEGFLPLLWEEVRQMQKEGFEIGSHTRTHFDCGSRNAAALENEIVGSKEELERRLGHRIEFFSFPFGLPLNISREAAELAAETYPYLLSAFGGDNMAGTEPQHLRRRCHPQRLWDLELQIQGVLETEPDSPYWLEKRDCTKKGITIVDSIDESAAS